MAKFLPIIGEIYTAAESAVCVTAGSLAKICGDDKAASELFDASGNAWKEYAETNMIAAPVHMIVSDIQGDYSKRDEIVDKYGSLWSNTADALPVVGKFDVVLDFDH
jgi:hypothetical protein